MKIIIVGGGKVGRATAKHLSGEGHDIVLVDKNYDRIQHISDRLDIMCVKGNCLKSGVLLSAGASSADLIIAATILGRNKYALLSYSQKTRRKTYHSQSPRPRILGGPCHSEKRNGA